MSAKVIQYKGQKYVRVDSMATDMVEDAILYEVIPAIEKRCRQGNVKIRCYPMVQSSNGPKVNFSIEGVVETGADRPTKTISILSDAIKVAKMELKKHLAGGDITTSKAEEKGFMARGYMTV